MYVFDHNSTVCMVVHFHHITIFRRFKNSKIPKNSQKTISLAVIKSFSLYLYTYSYTFIYTLHPYAATIYVHRLTKWCACVPISLSLFLSTFMFYLNFLYVAFVGECFAGEGGMTGWWVVWRKIYTNLI